MVPQSFIKKLNLGCEGVHYSDSSQWTCCFVKLCIHVNGEVLHEKSIN